MILALIACVCGGLLELGLVIGSITAAFAGSHLFAIQYNRRAKQQHEKHSSCGKCNHAE